MHLLHDAGVHEGGHLEVVELAGRADGVRDGRLELARRRGDRSAVPEAFDRRGGVDVERVGWASALRADLPAGVLEPAAPRMFRRAGPGTRVRSAALKTLELYVGLVEAPRG